ncbi:hypothetical protein, partial [Streptomyces rhizosphaericus]|uniref:hypothetical protein n=2 Tax=Actinomycetes TaxID=1760 RepID=UPI0031D776A7
RSRPFLVLDTWQSLCHHRLSAERRKDFLAHPDVEAIGSFDHETIELAARRAMAANDGDLLLTQWLEEARERDRKQRARAEIPDWKRNLPPG